MPHDTDNREPASQPTSQSARPPATAALAGVRDAIGVPAAVLGASYLGLGALVQQADLTVWHGLYSTATGWALPGQVAALELYSVGAPLLVVLFAVGLVNARLLPMTITVIPLLRSPTMPRWAYYIAAHWIAVTAWAAAMRACPKLPPEERLPYFVGLGMTLWTVTLSTTAIGFALAGAVPAYVTLGLVFLNPIYFMLVFAADVRHRPRVLALILGALAGPPLYWLTPDWGLVAAGLVAGTAAFAATRHQRPTHG